MTDIFMISASCAVKITWDEKAYMTPKSSENILESFKCSDMK